MPVIVRKLDDEQVIIEMVASGIQRKLLKAKNNKKSGAFISIPLFATF